MAIDTSMYANLQTPDIIGGFQRGMQMRDQMDQRAERKSLKDAYAAGVKMNADGTVSFDPNAVMGNLAKGGFGAEAMELNQQTQAQSAAKQKTAMEKQLHDLEMDGRDFASVSDESTYQAALKNAASRGRDISQFPQQYDPNFVKMAYGRTLSAKDQYQQKFDMMKFEAEQANKKRELSQKDRELDQKAREAQLSPKLTEGQKKVDEEFGKDYNQWTSGGAKSARSEIKKLEDVVAGLKGGNVTTGGLTGFFPDRMTSDGVLKARADVNSTVMNSLRAILGAQFTEKEGERIIKNTWNEADSTNNNITRLERLVGDLTAQADDKDSKAKFFESNRASLSGFRPAPTYSLEELMAERARRNQSKQQAGSGGGKPNG